ncbi:MAG: DUF3348 family protein [Parahaliea sp.]
MNPAPATTTFAHTRLVSLLASLGGPALKKVEPRQFGPRLGGLIDLSSSVALADTLGGLDKAAFEVAEEQPARAREDFFRVRAAMISAVMRSLVPGSGPSRIIWPEEVSADGGADALKRFYAAHQREMEARVRGLQERVRHVLLDTDPALARLATLDTALANALLSHTRRLFAGIPALVARRQVALREVEGGPQQLKAELQGLLLAEVDARLLPVQGLVEALEDHLNDCASKHADKRAAKRKASESETDE